jgi:hypothetical protein
MQVCTPKSSDSHHLDISVDDFGLQRTFNDILHIVGTHEVFPSLDQRVCSGFAGIEDVVHIGHAANATLLVNGFQPGNGHALHW